MLNKKRIFIVGPTAVGKSALGVRLAQAVHGAILSMDSMQIYRGMDIGTAKVTAAERGDVPHFLIDIQNPGDAFSVHDYQQAAKRIQDALVACDVVPLYVGGTGLYLDAMVRDFQFHETPPQPALRKALEKRYDADEGRDLYAELQRRDPELAKKLTPKDRPRLIRAHEVLAQRENTVSLATSADGPDAAWENLIFVLHRPRQALYRAIDQRVQSMLEAGLINEVNALVQSGVPREAQAMRAIGYRETLWYLRGLINRRELKELIQRFSRNYAKRQLTWFRKTPKAIWLDVEDDVYPEMLAITRRFLSEPSDQ
ncbi:MAG: tRNA (adenosine(37)-N6)-dimethylallyltransferase MiaA [Peptoniphilaceae bacterium]|nr:tRNA (adenosine(37)-N6)-dimethylallyltransferase MiaA [Peptoniphilaceae bacterium]MDY6086036.1 tRNA (adenosine(37)-N6)-dimethylallyltransferase MiaA [Peptoniphilaceae bacterium]